MRSGYNLLDKKVFVDRIDVLKSIYRKCILCPHKCEVDRTKGERGKCKSGTSSYVSSYNKHFGEEPPISGTKGSGTIFLTGCTGRCIFCQNYPISQFGTGNEVSDEELAEMMLKLQDDGCHNINFVTPTHFAPSIVSSIFIASQNGLEIPIVYNTSGYENSEIIKLLDGIVDIYLPDAKYDDDVIAENISGFINYCENNRRSIIEMFRQVGNLKIENGIAKKGLIIRHLILPDNYSGSTNIFRFISESISENVYFSIMDQFFPAYKSLNHKSLSRRISQKEYDDAIDAFYDYGLHNGWIQEHIN